MGIHFKKKLFVNNRILISKEIFMIFDYCVHNRRYIEDMNMDPKCVLALIFVSVFEIVNFTKLKDS